MQKMMMIVGAAGVAIASIAAAHPTGVAYETRGECEAAYAESSKLDRERLVAAGVFESRGAAQRTFNEIFSCEYDEAEDAWRAHAQRTVDDAQMKYVIVHLHKLLEPDLPAA